MAETSLAARLKETHPLYQKFFADWQFYADSYEGGTEYTSKDAYLFKHARETPNDYAERIERAVFTNFVRKQIDVYAAFIFKDPIERQTTDAAFKDFELNADRRGTPLSQIMAEQVGKVGMIHGHTVTVVDLPRDASTSKTRRQDKEKGIRPYVRVYSPLEVVDWALDADGSYRWLRVCEDAVETLDPFDTRGQAKRIYRTWTREGFYVHDDEGTEIDAGEHKLGEVPAVFTPVKEHLKYVDIGESLVVDTAALNRRIYNYESVLDEFIYRQAFNILAMPYDPEKTPLGASAGSGGSQNAAPTTVGTGKGIRFPNSGTPPFYLSPPTPPAEVIMERIEKAQARLVEVAKLQDRKVSAAEKSGIAMKYEFHESNSAFAKIAKNLEDGEKKIVRLFYKWQGKDDGPVSVTYPSDFNLSTLAEQLEEALTLVELNVSPTFTKQVKKGVVAAAMPGLDAKTEKVITDEIDSEQGTNEVIAEVERRLQEAEQKPAA
jgi:hypothetical protein